MENWRRKILRAYYIGGGEQLPRNLMTLEEKHRQLPQGKYLQIKDQEERHREKANSKRQNRREMAIKSKRINRKKNKIAGALADATG